MANKQGDAALAKCESCDATFVLHKWGSIKAHEEGWYESKDGKRWCPLHVPEWVTEWRARKKAQKQSPNS